MTAQYIGVDYSSRKFAAVRLCAGESTIVYSHEVPSKSFPGRMDAMVEIHHLMAEFIGMFVDDGRSIPPRPVMVIESPIMGISRDVQTALWMGMTAGGLVIAASDYDIKPYLAAPSTWKKQVCGKGNLRKEGVSDWLREREPALWSLTHNDDERDAMCLALYAKAIDKETQDGRQEAEKASGGR